MRAILLLCMLLNLTTCITYTPRPLPHKAPKSDTQLSDIQIRTTLMRTVCALTIYNKDGMFILTGSTVYVGEVTGVDLIHTLLYEHTYMFVTAAHMLAPMVDDPTFSEWSDLEITSFQYTKDGQALGQTNLFTDRFFTTSNYPQLDLAVIFISTDEEIDLVPAILPSKERLQGVGFGDRVYLIGRSLALPPFIYDARIGCTSWVSDDIEASYLVGLTIGAGASGGGVFNDRGELISIVSRAGHGVTISSPILPLYDIVKPKVISRVEELGESP